MGIKGDRPVVKHTTRGEFTGSTHFGSPEFHIPQPSAPLPQFKFAAEVPSTCSQGRTSGCGLEGLARPRTHDHPEFLVLAVEDWLQPTNAAAWLMEKTKGNKPMTLLEDADVIM